MCFSCNSSSDLQAQLTPWSADVPCNFTLEVYACAEVSQRLTQQGGRRGEERGALFVSISKLVFHTHTQLENFTANHLASLLQCDLPGESSDSKVLWKMLLSKLSHVLDPALDVLAEMVSRCHCTEERPQTQSLFK